MRSSRPEWVDPALARTHENLSFLAVLTEDFDEARDHARKALEIDPKLASSWNNLGIALYNLGSAEEAVSAWERSLELTPDDPESLLNLGQVHAQLGDRKRAAEALIRLLGVAQGPAYEAQRARAIELLRQLKTGG